MDEITDNEYLPNQEALGPFRADANREAPALDHSFWLQLDLSEQRADELADVKRQREAVGKLIKKDLAQKLQQFYAVYFVTFFLIVFVGAFVSRYLPEFRQPDKLKLILAANGVYFCFLMTLSLFYELKQLVKWYFSLGTFILLAIGPFIYERYLLSVPLNTLGLVIAAIVLVLFSICFFTISHTGKRLKASIWRTREKNSKENLKRTEFVNRLLDFIPIEGGRLRKLLHRWFIKYAAHTAYSVLTCDDCKRKKVALQEFKERHRFKDSMGRLATVVWIAGSIAYLYLNIIPEVEAIPAAAASVLPVYSLSMLIMDQIDEKRDKALADVIELIKPDIGDES